MRPLRSLPMWGAVAAMLASTAGPAAGHEEQRTDIAVELDAPPRALHGVTIGLHKTLTHQLVVENKTGEWLEVIGATGRAFLRIGPGGVEADLASSEWYRTYTAIGIPAPTAARDQGAAPRWSTVRRAPTWGWFDLRLRTDRVSVPHEVMHAGQAAPIGRFSVPLRIGGEATQVTGTFRYAPAPAGYFAARLVGSGEIAPGVRLHVLAGTPPGLYLENARPEPVTILGAQGEPFLRVGPEGVYANIQSPAWLASGQAEVTDPAAIADVTAPPLWQRRSPSPRFAWVEPRLGGHRRGPSHILHDTGGAREVERWEIAFLHGEVLRKITGAIDWIPIIGSRRTSSP